MRRTDRNRRKTNPGEANKNRRSRRHIRRRATSQFDIRLPAPPCMAQTFGTNAMRIAPSQVLIVCAGLLSSCSPKPSGLDLQDALVRSLPHDTTLSPPNASASLTEDLTAKGRNWSVSVKWTPGELTRFVTWREGDQGFSLMIPLRNRSRPFTTSYDGVTMTRYGPYQPACEHRSGRDRWHVMMSHEQVDFPSNADLVKKLRGTVGAAHHANSVLSPTGVMLSLCGPSYSGGSSLDIQVWILTVNGKQPSAEVLAPFLKGELTVTSHTKAEQDVPR